MGEVTRILSAIGQGDPRAAGQLLPLVYDEWRKLAAQRLARHSARYKSNTPAAVRGWEQPRQAFGLVGAARGLQGDE